MSIQKMGHNTFQISIQKNYYRYLLQGLTPISQNIV